MISNMLLTACSCSFRNVAPEVCGEPYTVLLSFKRTLSVFFEAIQNASSML